MPRAAGSPDDHGLTWALTAHQCHAQRLPRQVSQVCCWVWGWAVYMFEVL